MIRLKLCTGFLFILVAFSLVSASFNVNIEVSNDFTIGNMIKFSYTITSTENSAIAYTPYVQCQSTPQPFMEIRNANLVNSVPYSSEYKFIEVTQDIATQDCTAYISILSPIEQRFEKNFTIDTMPVISFRSLFCKDSSCETESKIFLQNEDIYFSYISDAVNPLITATLTYPDGTTSQIDLPTSIKAEQIGTYTLEATVSKEGYKSVTKTEQFGVIEKEAEIMAVSSSATETNEPAIQEAICNNDEICSGEETTENCPSDCKIAEETQEEGQKGETPDKEKYFYIFVGIIIAIVAILLIVLFIINRKVS